MRYSKIFTAMLVSPLPFIVAGCLTSPHQRQEPIYEQTMSKAQIEQTWIEQQIRVKQQQKQKIIQQNSSSQTVHLHHYPQPYQVNRAAIPNRAVANPPQAEQGQYNPQVREAAQVQQAKQNSLVEEDLRRRGAAKEEARQLEQARQNSLRTLATDEARRQQAAAAEEARQIEQATQESLRTHAEETARRQQAAAVASQPVVPQSVVQPVAVPAPEWEPNSGHLVRAGEFVMELKRSKGGIHPTHAEMLQHIQANMGVSAGQAEKILEELGL